MDVCQLKPDTPQEDWVPVERDRFELATRRQYPWYRPVANGGASLGIAAYGDRETGQYAVCPVCDNPIQIVGLYSAKQGTPYGRHLSHAVPDLADFDQIERDGCNLYKPLKLAKTALKPAIDRQGQRALRNLIETFDLVVALLKHDTGILFSEKLLGRMLERFRDERGYLYRGANALNIAWMFAYFSDSNSLWWQFCRDDSGLPHEIAMALPKARRTAGGLQMRTTQFTPESDGKPTASLEKLDFCFVKHRPVNGSEPENMTMLISYGDGRGKVRDIVSRRIDFDYGALGKMIRSGTKRKPELVELARDKLGDLLPPGDGK